MDNGEPTYNEDFFKPGTFIQMGNGDGNDRDYGGNDDEDTEDYGNGNDNIEDDGNGNEDKEDDGEDFFWANEEREGEDIRRKM